MGFDLATAALWLDMPGNRKLVLVALCDRASMETGLCWPGRAEIAIRSSLSERSVTPHLQALEAAGYVRSGPNPRSAGKTTHRWVNVDRILRESESNRREHLARVRADLEEESSPSPQGSTGSSAHQLGEDGVDLGEVAADLGEAASPVTVIEPSKEPSGEPVAAAAAVKLWEEATAQTLAPITRELIASAGEQHGIDTIRDAIQEAAQANVLKWSYVASILRRWESEGRKPKGRRGGGNPENGPMPTNFEERRERFAGGKWGHLGRAK